MSLGDEDQRANKFAKGAGGTGRTSRGTKRTGSFTASSPPTGDSQTKEILSLLMKQTLKNTQDMRRVKATVFDCLTIATSSPVFEAISEERAKYVKNQESDGTRVIFHPDPFLFQSFVDEVAHSDIGAKSKTLLQQASQTLFDSPMDDTMLLAPSFF